MGKTHLIYSPSYDPNLIIPFYSNTPTKLPPMTPNSIFQHMLTEYDPGIDSSSRSNFVFLCSFGVDFFLSSTISKPISLSTTIPLSLFFPSPALVPDIIPTLGPSGCIKNISITPITTPTIAIVRASSSHCIETILSL
ncbi:hypothetical protein M9H77_16311 [Catharanthus roseus]|uniref:Uncharacterized protein n=1 Tax=Catharanthus roseus TaxID=4058 RepID=A0ACC0B1I8_CATRO|nr:hypothetical protein M9H77_16311 [Catharanthus roseus]